jgi:hypothetical protein
LGAVVHGPAAIALRETNFLLLAQSELLKELADVADADLGGAIDISDSRLRIFRKPDDIWNKHNVLVEDIDNGIEMLIRLRQRLNGVSNLS